MIPYGVGDMVVCIYDGVWYHGCPDAPPQYLPHKGCIYTVRDMNKKCNNIYVHLVEIVNAPFLGDEAAFRADLFRPVKKTSIESLERICLAAPTKKVIEVIE